MISNSKIPWSQILMAIFLYATVLVYQGYIYGAGDQSQILPCLYAMDYPGFFTSDHYVTSYLAGSINERAVFHFIFRYLGYDSPTMMLIWHALFSITLIWAWIRIAEWGIKTKIFQYLAVASILIIGVHTSVGDNELYYNSLVPSLVAKAIASWALYFWLEGKYRYWIIGLVIATFIQPLVGLQLFLLTATALLLSRFIEKAPRIIPWLWMLGYVIVILPWFYLLAKNNGGHTNPDLFMEIMDFRLAHHFYPFSFGLLDKFVFGVLAIIVLSFYKHRLRYFMILIIVGCMVYIIGVEFMNEPLILYSQWFKTTIWLEAFALIAIFVGLEKLLKKLERFSKYWIVIPVLGLLLISTYRLSGWFGTPPSYMVTGIQEKSAEVDISLQAKEVTDVDAVFIVPVEFTAFRWYAKRNLYIDYKALFHQEDFLNSWYDRIGNIYAYSIEEQHSGFDIHDFSRELLSEPSQVSLEYWKSLGITHIVSSNPAIEGLEVIAGNEGYYVYGL
jgi:hypothetical protein